MQLRRHRASPNRLDIPVTRQQQLRIKRLQQLGPPLRSVWPCHQLQQWVGLEPLLCILQHQGQGRRGLRNQLDRPKPHRVAAKAGARQADDVARAPGHTPAGLIGNDRPRGRGFRLRNRLTRPPFEKIKNHAAALPAH